MRQVRILRALVLLALLLFIGVVFTSYRRQKGIADSSTGGFRPPGEGQSAIHEEFSRRDYQRDQLKSEIKAREVVNYQDGVNLLRGVDFTRQEDGLRIRADLGRHEEASGATLLWENVVISNRAGMTIETASALYDQAAGRVVGERPVRFRDRRMEGRATGVVYDLGQEILQLPDAVSLVIQTGHPEEDSPGEPLRVQAGHLHYDRRTGKALLAKGTTLERGRFHLSCATLLLEVTEGEKGLRSATATGDVLCEMAAGVEALGEAGASGLEALGNDPGRKELRADQLEILFASEASGDPGRVDYLVARAPGGGKAVLTVFPGETASAGGGGTQARRVEGETLTFRFLGQGPANRLEAFRAEGECLLALVAPDAPAGPGGSVRGREPEIRLTGRELNASFDARTQEVTSAELIGDVRFTRGEETASGERALLDGEGRLLSVFGTAGGPPPRLTKRDLEMEAARFSYTLDGRVLTAEEAVWVKILPAAGDEAGLDLALFRRERSDEPIYVHADRLVSDRGAELSIFEGSVRALQGENVLSARELRLFHRLKRMEARERVLLTIQPLPGSMAATAVEAVPDLPVVPNLPVDSLTRSAAALPLPSAGAAGSPPPEDDDQLFGLARSAPLEIRCSQLVYDDLGRLIELDGEVRLRKDRTTIRGDHFDLSLAPESNQIERIAAYALEGARPVEETAAQVAGRSWSGFSDQEEARRRERRPPPPADTGEASEEGEGGADLEGEEAARVTEPDGSPAIPLVTLTQAGGRKATAEKLFYYPQEEIAVLIGSRKVATVLDPRRGSAQGNALTYHLADGKIFNHANEDEVTLVTLRSSSAEEEKGGESTKSRTSAPAPGATASVPPAGGGAPAEEAR